MPEKFQGLVATLYTKYILEKLSEVLGMDKDKLEEQILENSKRLFKSL